MTNLISGPWSRPVLPCRRRDSNPHLHGPKPCASANWATSACPGLPRRALACHAMVNQTAPTTGSDLDIRSASAFDPMTEVYTRLLGERIIFLGSEVNDTVANLLTAQMLHLEGQDPEADIWLYINSPGGSVSAGLAIYDTMQFIQPDVGTICTGLGASMGQFLLCAGEPGKRIALPHARIMMHQPSGGFQGQASDIAIQAEQMAYTKKLLAERIAHHTGQSVDQIQEDSERDRWFTAEEARDYGIIDKVIVRRGEML